MAAEGACSVGRVTRQAAGGSARGRATGRPTGHVRRPWRARARAWCAVAVLAFGAAACGGTADVDGADAAGPRSLAQAARRWGLASAPLAAPRSPDRGPRPSGQGLPSVVSRVPTRDKVVFLTIDDGVHKDPAFLRMTRELRIPYTAFLTDRWIRDDYGYFARVRRLGGTLNNHTVNHPRLPGLSPARQRAEICGMRDVLARRYGERPGLFRPPYGAYDATTLSAAASCGIRTVVLWQEQAFVDRIAYDRGDGRLRPGDIILTHFRGPESWNGTMNDMLRHVLTQATAQGYAVARLEDYI